VTVAQLRAATALALLGAACLLLVAPPPAHTAEATGAEVNRLARQALRGDVQALAALREVDRVDGRPVELADALGPGRPTARLRALAERPPQPAPDAAAARAKARSVLADDRFQEPSIPRPLQGVFSWIGVTVSPLVEAVGDLLDGIAVRTPGGRPVGLTLAAVLVLLAFAALASRMVRRRARRVAASALHERAHASGPSPEELERAAADAESAGDLSLAVRLRFRAGLLALERQGTISLRASLTTAAIERRLDSPEFAAVAERFEQVAYGGRIPDRRDVEAQRTGWRRVLEEAGA
jgi:hypothetical protein